MKILTCIHRVPIFQALPATSVEKLHRVAKHQHFQRGDQVVRSGQPIKHLMVVIQGHLTLRKTNRNGREQVVRELGPGDIYGELALFTELVSDGDLVAVAETDVCQVERDAVQEVLKETPQVTWSLVESLAHRLAQAEHLVADLGLLDVAERLASELLRLAESSTTASPTVEEGGVRFTLPYSWGQLATRLGTTSESLSRRLKKLSQAGLLEIDGRTVIIHDMASLRDLVNGI